MFVEALTRGSNIPTGSLISGGLTLAVLVLPIVIITTSEALRAVPRAIREAAYGVGATRWEVIRSHVLPYALPGILTGRGPHPGARVRRDGAAAAGGRRTGFFATGRGRGQDPSSLYGAPRADLHWTKRPQHAFQDLAAAAIIVMMVVLV